MIKVYRTEKESGDRMIQRFSNKMKASRLVQVVRDKRYYKKKPSKRFQRMAAVMRDYYRAKREREKYYN